MQGCLFRVNKYITLRRILFARPVYRMVIFPGYQGMATAKGYKSSWLIRNAPISTGTIARIVPLGMNLCGWHASKRKPGKCWIGEIRGEGDCRDASGTGKISQDEFCQKGILEVLKYFFLSAIGRKQASVERSAVRRGAEREAILSRRHSNAHAHKRQALFRLL